MYYSQETFLVLFCICFTTSGKILNVSLEVQFFIAVSSPKLPNFYRKFVNQSKRPLNSRTRELTSYAQTQLFAVLHQQILLFLAEQLVISQFHIPGFAALTGLVVTLMEVNFHYNVPSKLLVTGFEERVLRKRKWFNLRKRKWLLGYSYNLPSIHKSKMIVVVSYHHRYPQTLYLH